MASSSSHQHREGWHSGLCECHKDCSTSCITCWAPCVTFGQIGEILDSGNRSCLMNGMFYMGAACVSCPWVYTTQYRTKLRLKFGLPPAPCNDCAVHFFCEACALCQEHRELKARGIDPALGWTANADKYTHIAPPQPHVMQK
ncbi:hypothetical protein GOP47_0019897 [Adiantum capillus-veneris]|uniref:Uncharacterized protein n=1 Tax=Adiantum capillus-veneris TaxID=13818 RepID=A0A9D4UCN0_ADICA|nr:hypothetical protein GOP47_0019897 [Adiantum capillus-veneris]